MERRASPRIPVHRPGRIEFESGRGKDCVVLNLSATGAKLSVSKAAILPGEFDLAAPAWPRPQRARMVWRRDDEVGVCFV